MRVLITGATGFIGTHLCHRLVAEGHRVVALVRDPAKAGGLPKEGVELLRGDLSLFTRPDLVLPECEAVVHLAGVVTAKRLSDYHDVNFVAVQHLVQALARQAWKPRRLLFASSLAASGPSRDGALRTEADGCAPVEPYGESKMRAEDFLRSAPFPTTSFRPALVFGPNDPATVTLFRLARRGLGFQVAGRDPGLSWVQIDDLLDALVLLLGDPSTDHRTYFVSHPAPTTNRGLWTALGATFGRKVRVLPLPRPLLYGAMVTMTALSKAFGFTNQLDEKQYEQLTAPGFVCSSALLTKDFGWRARFELEAALRRAADGYREAGWF
ncbi:MAG: NAD-dependent epimerase/dehydratase family protein [Archangium sp.]|nr:NAD-dependent epimerase/dehydratase family protein [Archangium sp.]